MNRYDPAAYTHPRLSSPGPDHAPDHASDSDDYLNGVNAAWLESLYQNYRQNPKSVDEQWQAFFADVAKTGQQSSTEQQSGPPAVAPSWQRPGWPPVADGELVSALDGQWPDDGQSDSKLPDDAEQVRQIETRIREAAQQAEACIPDTEVYTRRRETVGALRLIKAYRIRGHLIADLDPLRLAPRIAHPDLQIETYGFTHNSLDRVIFLDGALGLQTATLKEILAIVTRTYCGKVGMEFMHLSDPEQLDWLQQRMEGYGNEISFTTRGKRAILNKLIEAETFEHFLDKKFTGTKRFGIEGAEALIPALEQFIKRGGNLGVREIVIGMAHRGRLNVLGNVMGKPQRAIMHEFQGGSSTPDDVWGSGDVKYHLGASSDRSFDGNNVHLSLSPNPSHLEAVDPVVLGKARAKQDFRHDGDRSRVMPLLLHGDAAFAGQGVVAECFAMTNLCGNKTGGSIHFIINNQIGFTTTPRFARSSPYPSDVAKMVEAPIFHVNGDDPEAVVHMARVATEFQQKFAKPVVLDMFCYRRHGHNESDEPAFTQPIMYKRIKAHPGVAKIYAERLINEGVITRSEVEAMRTNYENHLASELAAAPDYKPGRADWLGGRWSAIRADLDDETRRGCTAVSMDVLKQVGKRITRIPDSVNVHKTVRRIFERRRKMIETGTDIDWATAEALAFGTLLQEKYPVRLCGQDVERGTFSQRHSAIVDQDTEDRYYPLNNVSPDQAPFMVINSMLSEYAVLGFEYGYSLSEPNGLVLWEAQFGDFANGAQVIIDQFVAAGERKWLRMSGLVMLLPHGYEGQGPEHSSARLERYLQLCAEDNWQVVNVTTPANYFHVLRRQLHRQFRKPLIVMTPKSLLRGKWAVSSLEDMGPDTSFHRVLCDRADLYPEETVTLQPDNQIRRVIMCSGKVYFDLYKARAERRITDVYLLRIEQFYPFPARALISELARFAHAEMIWCQEEPKNMGGWSFIEPNIAWVLDHIDARYKHPRYVGRPASAATATGIPARHKEEVQAFLDEAFRM